MGSSWWPSSASNGRKASDEFAVPHEGLDFVATREFFPKTLAASIKQKARWVYGINLRGDVQAWLEGWPVGLLFLCPRPQGPDYELSAAALPPFARPSCPWLSSQELSRWRCGHAALATDARSFTVRRHPRWCMS